MTNAQIMIDVAMDEYQASHGNRIARRNRVFQARCSAIMQPIAPITRGGYHSMPLLKQIMRCITASDFASSGLQRNRTQPITTTESVNSQAIERGKTFPDH